MKYFPLHKHTGLQISLKFCRVALPTQLAILAKATQKASLLIVYRSVLGTGHVLLCRKGNRDRSEMQFVELIKQQAFHLFP